MKFSMRLLEQALDDFLLEAEHSFTLEQAVEVVAETLAAEPTDMTEITQEMEILLKEYDLFFDAEDKSYITQSEFFKDAQFCVTPSEYEIRHGYLIPGHRFSSFTCDSVFPSEVELTEAGETAHLDTIDKECAIHDAAAFHTLLGSEEMFHYFIADHQKNHEIITAGDPESNLLLTVFDFKAFFDKHSFEHGDALIFTVKDWDNGIFTFEYQAQIERDESDRSAWSEAFETALATVFDDKGYYTTIPEQLSLAYFSAGDAVFAKPAMSVDEFMATTSKVAIIMVGGQTVLWNHEELAASESESDDEYPMDEGVMVSQGKTDSVQDILKDIGCTMTALELDSLMYNELYQGGESLEPVIDRVLYFKEGSFSDDAQEAVFLNFIEERWEDIIDSYRRDSDQDKGSIRRRVMQFLDERLRFFLELGEAQNDISEELVNALDNNVNNLNNLLAMLNSDYFFSDQDEFDKVMDGAEHMGSAQANLLAEIEQTLNT